MHHVTRAIVALAFVGSLSAGCNANKKSADESGAEDSPRAKKKAPSKVELTTSLKDGYGGILGEFYEGMDEGKEGGGLFFSGAPHMPEEPDTFSAAWVGREAGIVLRRAVDKELPYTTVQARGHQCLLFHEGNMVRRLVFKIDDQSSEYAMSAAGDIILWYGAESGDPRQNEVAFFHKRRLKQYQVWEGSSPRRNEPPPEGLEGFINREARACLEAFGATNPMPGAPAAPPPPPDAPSAEAIPTIKIDRTEFEKGDAITVRLGVTLAPPEGQKYWITLIRPDAPDTDFGSWQYVASGASSHTLEATEPGDWEIRLHDVYPKYKTGRVLSRQRIKITGAKAAPAKAQNACSCSLGGAYWGPCERTGCQAGYTCSSRDDGGDGNCYCNCR